MQPIQQSNCIGHPTRRTEYGNEDIMYEVKYLSNTFHTDSCGNDCDFEYY